MAQSPIEKWLIANTLRANASSGTLDRVYAGKSQKDFAYSMPEPTVPTTKTPDTETAEDKVKRIALSTLLGIGRGAVSTGEVLKDTAQTLQDFASGDFKKNVLQYEQAGLKPYQAGIKAFNTHDTLPDLVQKYDEFVAPIEQRNLKGTTAESIAETIGEFAVPYSGASKATKIGKLGKVADDAEKVIKEAGVFSKAGGKALLKHEATEIPATTITYIPLESSKDPEDRQPLFNWIGENYLGGIALRTGMAGVGKVGKAIYSGARDRAKFGDTPAAGNVGEAFKRGGVDTTLDSQITERPKFNMNEILQETPAVQTTSERVPGGWKHGKNTSVYSFGTGNKRRLSVYPVLNDVDTVIGETDFGDPIHGKKKAITGYRVLEMDDDGHRMHIGETYPARFDAMEAANHYINTKGELPQGTAVRLGEGKAGNTQLALKQANIGVPLMHSRGNKGKIQLVFVDKDHADLYQLGKLFVQHSRGNLKADQAPQIRAVTARLKKSMPEIAGDKGNNRFAQVAMGYFNTVRSAANGAEKDATHFYAPALTERAAKAGAEEIKKKMRRVEVNRQFPETPEVIEAGRVPGTADVREYGLDLGNIYRVTVDKKVGSYDIGQSMELELADIKRTAKTGKTTLVFVDVYGREHKLPANNIHWDLLEQKQPQSEVDVTPPITQDDISEIIRRAQEETPTEPPAPPVQKPKKALKPEDLEMPQRKNPVVATNKLTGADVDARMQELCGYSDSRYVQTPQGGMTVTEYIHFLKSMDIKNVGVIKQVADKFGKNVDDKGVAAIVNSVLARDFKDVEAKALADSRKFIKDDLRKKASKVDTPTVEQQVEEVVKITGKDVDVEIANLQKKADEMGITRIVQNGRKMHYKETTVLGKIAKRMNLPVDSMDVRIMLRAVEMRDFKDVSAEERQLIRKHIKDNLREKPKRVRTPKAKKAEQPKTEEPEVTQQAVAEYNDDINDFGAGNPDPHHVSRIDVEKTIDSIVRYADSHNVSQVVTAMTNGGVDDKAILDIIGKLTDYASDSKQAYTMLQAVRLRNNLLHENDGKALRKILYGELRKNKQNATEVRPGVVHVNDIVNYREKQLGRPITKDELRIAIKEVEKTGSTVEGAKEHPLFQSKTRKKIAEDTATVIKIEDAARRRLAQKVSNGDVNNLKFKADDPLPYIYDAAIIGACKIARAGLNFADFSVQMIEEFGEAVRPYLSELWSRANSILKQNFSNLESSATLDKPEIVPTFYSQTLVAVNKMKPKTNAKQVLDYLRNEVSAEELQWTGVEQWLQGRKNVTKDELLDFVSSNNLMIEEKVLSNSYGQLKQQFRQSLADVDEIELQLNQTTDRLERVFKINPGAVGTVRHNGWLNKVLELTKSIEDLKNQLKDKRAETDQLEKELDNARSNTTRWGLYDFTAQELEIPGGEDYHELLLKLPYDEQSSGFDSAHWEEPNVLAHVRFNTRYTPEGKKVLFLEEVQSDWHQQGREEGYIGKESKLNTEHVINQTKSEIEQTEQAKQSAFQQFKQSSVSLDGTFYIRVLEDTDDFFSTEYNFEFDLVPLAPDKVPTVEGYSSLRELFKSNTDKYPHDKQQEILSAFNKYFDELNNLVNLQNQLDLLNSGNYGIGVADAPFKENWHELVMKRMLRYAAENDFDEVAWTTGQQQHKRYGVEGKGHLDFYDQKLPNFMAKYVKQWNSSVRLDTDVITKYRLEAVDSTGMFNIRDTNGALVNPRELEAESARNIAKRLNEVYSNNPVHAVDVTPQMKNSVLYEGQSMFSSPKKSPTIMQGEAVAPKRLKIKDWIAEQQRVGIVSDPETIQFWNRKLSDNRKIAQELTERGVNGEFLRTLESFSGETLAKSEAHRIARYEHYKALKEQVKTAEELDRMVRQHNASWSDIVADLHEQSANIGDKILEINNVRDAEIVADPEFIRLSVAMEPRRREFLARLNQRRIAEKLPLTPKLYNEQLLAIRKELLNTDEFAGYSDQSPKEVKDALKARIKELLKERGFETTKKINKADATSVAKRLEVIRKELMSTEFSDLAEMRNQRKAIVRTTKGKYDNQLAKLHELRDFTEAMAREPEQTLRKLRTDARDMHLDMISNGNWYKIKNAIDSVYTRYTYNAFLRGNTVMENEKRVLLDRAETYASQKATENVNMVLGVLKTPTERYLFETTLVLRGIRQDLIDKRAIPADFGIKSVGEIDTELAKITHYIQEIDRRADGKVFVAGAEKRINKALEKHFELTHDMLKKFYREGRISREKLEHGMDWYFPHNLLHDVAKDMQLPDTLESDIRNLSMRLTPITPRNLKERFGSITMYDTDYERTMRDYYRRCFFSEQTIRALRVFYEKYDLRSVMSKRIVELSKLQGTPEYAREMARYNYELEQVRGFTRREIQVKSGFIAKDAFMFEGKLYRAYYMPTDLVVAKGQYADANLAINKALLDCAEDLGMNSSDYDEAMAVFKNKWSKVDETFKDTLENRFNPEHNVVNKVLYIPDELARELDRFFGAQELTKSPIYRLFREYTKGFKRHVLFYANLLPYAVNNLIGDSLKFMQEDPLGFISKDMAKTFNATMFNKSVPELEEMSIPINVLKDYNQLFELFENGGIKIGDTPGTAKVDVRKLSQLEDVTASGFVADMSGDLMAPIRPGENQLIAGFKNKHNRVVDIMRRREDWQRLHKFTVDLKRVTEGKKPSMTWHPELDDLQAISAAAWASRNTMVDYSALSPRMRVLRDTLFPFATWYFKNFGDGMRWMVQNSKDIAKYIGAKQGTDEAGRRNSAFVRMALCLTPLIGMWAWNNTGERKLVEERIPVAQRAIPHLVLTASVDAENYQIVSLQHPLVAAFSFIGLDKLLPLITDVTTGAKTDEEALTYFVHEVAQKQPLRQVGAQLNPLVRAPIEVMSNTQFYSGSPVMYGRYTPEGEKDTKGAAYIAGETMPLFGQFVLNPIQRGIQEKQGGGSFAEGVVKGEWTGLQRTLGTNVGADSFSVLPYKRYNSGALANRKYWEVAQGTKDAQTKASYNAQKMMVKYWLSGDNKYILEAKEKYGNVLSDEQLNNLLTDPKTQIEVVNARMSVATGAEREQLRQMKAQLQLMQMAQDSSQVVSKQQRPETLEKMRKLGFFK